MLVFGLIGLSLVLLGIVGLQFTYMFYADRMHTERRKHIHTLEYRSEQLKAQLEAARIQLAEQDEILKVEDRELRKEEELWADVIDER